jgi:threonylcarbamoyladenosine tRNA methylthiotransferase MtaB
MSLVDEAQLSFLHVFPFSARPHAPAARMPQHPPALVKERAANLRAKGEEALRRHLDSWIGRESTALVERPDFARLPDFTGVRIASGSTRFRFTGHDGANLIGAPA